MSTNETKFELPKNIERYLAALSKLYAQQGKHKKQEILVNSQVRVHEEWAYDNWNGGTYGHALYLVVPETLFLSVVKDKESVQEQIKNDLNRIHNVQNEFVAQVFLEMEIVEDHDWRKESGLLKSRIRFTMPEAEKRIWGDKGFRCFLSHKSEIKKEAADLKERLHVFGVSSFVAHEDIHPTKAWQDEIENALETMDGFVALMTEHFHQSDWTDQEVGFAVARGVPMLAVRLGKDPYGFIGKFQALSSSWQACAEDIVKVLIKNEKMFSSYVQALRKCKSWDDGNILAKILPAIEHLSTQQIDELLAAYNETSELRGSFGFNGSKKVVYGPGLLWNLERLGARRFKLDSSGLIEHG